MTQPYRIDSETRIDRSQPIRFKFNGKAYEGFAGDTLASALLANGVRLVGRSFKYHRPRGILTAGPDEPNALVQLEEGSKTVPNVKATQIELYDGLVARSVNCWPSVKFDLLAIADKLSRFLPPGFYYKTFMWPARFFHFYEWILRKSAGLGKAPTEADPDRYEKRNAHCDLLIVGAGPAGLSAALAAARRHARVILIEEDAEMGGRLLSESATINDIDGATWADAAVDTLCAEPNVTVLNRTTAIGLYDHNLVAAVERRSPSQPESLWRERLWRIRAKQVLLATGATERPLVFANNDRPGVMLASAVSTYINRFGVLAGRRAVIVTSNDSAYVTVHDIEKAGGKVVRVIDTRLSGPTVAFAAVSTDVIHGATVVDVHGKRSVTAVDVAQLAADGSADMSSSVRVECDLVVMSGGWSPVIHLSCHTGFKPYWNEDKSCFLPTGPREALQYAGSVNGVWTLADCLAQGAERANDALDRLGIQRVESTDKYSCSQSVQGSDARLSAVEISLKPNKQFVDYQMDVSRRDIELALREGYDSIEHVKRYTALGFGTDQGKLGNINGAAIVARRKSLPVGEVGTTTFRPPYTPTTFGALAGRDIGPTRFEPVRKTSIHKWHVDYGAVFENVGQWKRPHYYPVGEESMHEAVHRECLAARKSVGMLDASTLGKIDIQGPDAAEFLNRVYTNPFLKLSVGRCRYGLLLGEDGMIMDDGVTVRLDENHYLMHTTTGGAASVLSWLERWLQTEWMDLRVRMTSVTDHWATIAVVGPKSRELCTELSEGIDYSSEAFPFMSIQTGTVASVAARVFRISFSGELSYEVNVNANYAQHVWEHIYEVGQKYDITPYGTEAMHVLRAEKGFIIVGQDTDGSVTPVDVGMSWALGKNKDFLGKRSLARPAIDCDGRKQLVGLLTENPHDVLPEGAQLVGSLQKGESTKMIGYVTSSYFSPVLGRSIAMALVKDGAKKHGSTIYAALRSGQTVAAQIASSVFFDPEGERQNV